MKGVGFFGLCVSSRLTLSKQDEEIIRKIKEAGIPCEIMYGRPNSEPILMFNSMIFRGYEEIKSFIENWEKVWKPKYERLIEQNR